MYDSVIIEGAAMAEWFTTWPAEQEVRVSIPGVATCISEIGYLLLPGCNIAEMPLKRRKSSIQPTYPVIIERTKCLVLGPSTAVYTSFLKHCTPTNKVVGTI